MTLSLDAARSGMLTHQRDIDLIANNLANVNTTGYKRAKLHFQDVLDTAQILAALRGEAPEDLSTAAGVEMAGIARVFEQGSLEPTGRELDFAINGDGFFRVAMEDGTFAYTRDGSFRIDASGRLMTSSGLFLDPPIELPLTFRGLSVDADGTVRVIRPYTEAELEELAEDEPRDGIREVVGQIGLVRFSNPGGLESVGRNLYIETDTSQAPIEGEPGVDGMGGVLSGWLERSNVDVAEQMTALVVAMRAYQLNLNAYRTVEQMLSEANQLAGR